MDFPFTISLGRVMEQYRRVNDNDPSTAAILALVLAAAGLETDTVLRAKTTLTDLVSGTTNEATNGDYARKTLTDAELAPYTVNHADLSILAAIPLLSWTAGGGPDAGDNWSKLVLAYDPDPATSTDATRIPMTAHDLRISGSVIVPANTPIHVDLTAGFARARPR